MQEELAPMQPQEREDIVKNSKQTVEEWQRDSIKLNVGGKIFETTLATLRRFPGTLFHEILEGEEEKSMIKREDGTLFLDRCPEYFNFILNRLRNPEGAQIQPEDEMGRKMLDIEIKFYKLTNRNEHEE